MTNKFTHLQRQALDQHMAKLQLCDRPTGGWLTAVRKSLGMSARQMAERMGITQQSAARLEANEAQDAITLKSLRKAAEALNCRLVYALVPEGGSLQRLLDQQALGKAEEIVTAVDHTMQLEGQGVGNRTQKIQEIAEELAKNPNTTLWD
ncbi:MAG: mobile mystery protein A [Alphaproteobacteria bacterium]|nr:mobile mystery protein A [Alphaproteobacteria bacterium]